LGFVILLAENHEPSLAAKKKQQHGASETATSTSKNRVRGFEITPSGRPVVEPQISWETATGSVQYTYQIASGRAEWLSRDPIGEKSGINLYQYTRNNPLNMVDFLGLEGTWTFSITLSTYGPGHRPNIDASYAMSADEKKCCSEVTVRRSVSDLGFWHSDDSGYAYTDVKGNAHAEGDSPGGSKYFNNLLGDGSGTDLPSFPQTLHFKWDAVCTKGNNAGKTLSSRQRDYFVSGYNGAWEDSNGNLSIP